MPSKLLILTTDLQRGGTPIVVRELSLRLRARGHDVNVACLAPMGEIGQEIVAQGVTVHALGARGPRDVAVISRLIKLIRAGRYTHVYSLLFHANFAAAVVRPFLPRSIRWFQSVQTTQKKPAWHWPLQRVISPAARKILVPTESVATLLRDRLRVPPARIAVIPNAVDPAAWHLAPKRTDGTTRVLYLGRLDPIKRVPDLIAAMRELPPNFNLDVCGDGPEAPKLHELALGLPVTFHGFTRTAREALAQADLLVLPSEAEGFGLVLIEAMAASVPIVASDAPGIRDVIAHEKDGLLFPVGDVRALSRAILRLTREEGLAERLTTTGHRTVIEKYTWDRVLPEYERALNLL